MQQQSAVKAVIYDRDGRLFLQKRDNHSDVYDPVYAPGLWGFVGGLVEKGETLEGALEREIQEELGCKVSRVEGELFRADQGTHNILNVAYLVRIDLADDNIFLGDGKEYRWFSLDELVEIPLSHLVYRNVAFLLRALVKIDAEVEKKLEIALLEFCGVCKKNDRVFYAKVTPAMLSKQSIMLMKEHILLERELRRSQLVAQRAIDPAPQRIQNFRRQIFRPPHRRRIGNQRIEQRNVGRSRQQQTTEKE